MKLFCPKCKAKLKVDSDIEGCVPCPTCTETLDISALRTAICPICGCGFEESDEIRICPDCKTPHHIECWSENRGCSTYGCASAAHQETHTTNAASSGQRRVSGMITCPACGAMHPSTDLVCCSCGKLFGDTLPRDAATKSPPDVIYSMYKPDEYRNFAWRRWAARWIDFWVGYGIVMILFYGLAYLSGATGIGLGFWKWIAEPEHRIFDYILTTGLAFFSDTLVYSIFRTTIGKKINGISVCDTMGNRIDWKGFLRRDVKVLLRGEWLCIPLLSAIAQILQYNRVSKGKPTSYDNGSMYQSRPTRSKTLYDIIIVVAIFASYWWIRTASK